MTSRSLGATGRTVRALSERVIATGWPPRKFEFGNFLLGRQSWLRDENRQTRRHRQHLRERITFRHGRPPAFDRPGRRSTSERLRALLKIERCKRKGNAQADN